MKKQLNSIAKRDFLEIFHQQAANLKNCDQNIEFISRQNDFHHQIRNAHLHYDEITAEKDAAN